MSRQTQTDRALETMVGKLKTQQLTKAKIEEIFLKLVELFEFQTGCKVVNKKDLYLKLEKVK